MITLRKLLSLKGSTRIRKYIRLLRSFEEQIHGQEGPSPDQVYLRGLLGVIAEDGDLAASLRNRAGLLSVNLWNDRSPDDREILRACNGLRHAIMAELNMEPGDWDLLEVPGQDGTGERLSLPIYLYLEDIRSPFNVGAIFRSAEALGVREIFLSPDTASPLHRRAERSSMGTIDLVPWQTVPLEELTLPCFALELGGVDSGEFPFPRDGRESCALIGSEELGLSPLALEMAEDSLGRVSLPMRGRKGSLNVSVATGILLHDWAKGLS